MLNQPQRGALLAAATQCEQLQLYPKKEAAASTVVLLQHTCKDCENKTRVLQPNTRASAALAHQHSF